MSVLGRLFGLNRSQDYEEGIRLFDAGRYEEAAAALERVGRGTGRAADVLTQRLAVFYTGESYARLGAAALEADDAAGALEWLDRALAIHPHYADLHFRRGCALSLSGAPLAALDAFDQALDINGRYARAHLHRGILLYGLRRHDEALASLGRALDLEPGYAGETAAQARAAHDAGDWTAARTLWEQVARTDVEGGARHADLAADLYRRGLYPEAVEQFRAAVSLNPGYADLRNGLGMALHAAGSPEEAVAEFRRALAINPGYADARANLAHALRALGRDDEARAEFAHMVDHARAGALPPADRAA